MAAIFFQMDAVLIHFGIKDQCTHGIPSDFGSLFTLKSSINNKTPLPATAKSKTLHCFANQTDNK